MIISPHSERKCHAGSCAMGLPTQALSESWGQGQLGDIVWLSSGEKPGSRISYDSQTHHTRPMNLAHPSQNYCMSHPENSSPLCPTFREETPCPRASCLCRRNLASICPPEDQQREKPKSHTWVCHSSTHLRSSLGQPWFVRGETSCRTSLKSSSSSKPVSLPVKWEEQTRASGFPAPGSTASEPLRGEVLTKWIFMLPPRNSDAGSLWGMKGWESVTDESSAGVGTWDSSDALPFGIAGLCLLPEESGKLPPDCGIASRTSKRDTYVLMDKSRTLEVDFLLHLPFHLAKLQFLPLWDEEDNVSIYFTGLLYRED